MFLAWNTAGHDPEAFGRHTPCRLKLIMEASVRRREREHDERMHHAWWAGVIAKSAKTPELQTLLISRRREPDSPNRVVAALRAWLGAPPKKD